MTTRAVLTRMHSEEFVWAAIDQMRQVEDEVIWRILYSCEGRDNGEELDDALAVADLPKNVQTRVIKTGDINQHEALMRLIEDSREDFLYVFDDDNWFVPNRASLQEAICSNPRPICSVRSMAVVNGKVSFFFPDLRQKMNMILDTGSLRFNRDYALKRIVPATRRALEKLDAKAGLMFFEDRFWTGIGVLQGDVCYHPYPLNLYNRRVGGSVGKMGEDKINAMRLLTENLILEETGEKDMSEIERRMRTLIEVSKQ